MFRSLVSAVSAAFMFSSLAVAQARLGYQKEQLLKDAKYYINQIEGITEQIAAKSAPMKVGDPSVQIQDVDNLLANLDRCAQYAKNAESRFSQLPADHPQVQEEAKRFEACKKSLNEQQTKLKEIQAGLKNVVNQGGTADYKKDFQRLREINQMFGDPQILNTRPEDAIEIVRQIPNVKEERARIAQKYAALLQQSTGEAKDMNGVLRYFDEQFGNFDKAANAYADEAPAAIAADIKKVLDMGKTATEEKRHLWFNDQGGIAQFMGYAQTKLNVLSALRPDAPETKAAEKQLADARDQIKQMKASLNESILASNKPPEDRYNGGDKQQLLDLVKKQWADGGTGAEPMLIGINSYDWKRDTRWEWSKGNQAWEKYDKSRAQGFVVVKHNDKLAVARYINITKDHMSNDRITTYFFDDPKNEPDLNYLILLENVK